MNPDFTRIAGWIDQTYGVKTMNIIYDKIDNNKRPRLNIIFEESKDQQLITNKFGFDTLRQKEIAYQFERDSDNHKYDTHDILVIFSAFEPVAKIEIYWSVSRDEIRELELELGISDLWQIHPNTWVEPTFFFYTSAQVEQYSKNGTRDMLARKCFELFKKHDEFGYLRNRNFPF